MKKFARYFFEMSASGFQIKVLLKYMRYVTLHDLYEIHLIDYKFFGC